MSASERTLPLVHARSACAAALCVLVGALATGCRSEQTPPDLLLVTIDTLRPDFLSAYGHPRSSTPHIDALASEGALFERHYSVMSLTAPSHASLFTGLYPSEHGLWRNGFELEQELPSLPQSLREAGYHTAGVVAVSLLGERYGFARGFADFDDQFEQAAATPRPTHQRGGEEVIDRALELLADADERPLFLWVHLFDPHDPYAAPVPSGLDETSGRALFAERAEISGRFRPDAIVDNQLAYEHEVAYVDAQIGRLLDAWDARERGRDGLVALTADHGEGLGEHKLMGHGHFLYEEQVRVPLVLRFPDRVPAGLRVRSISSVVDLSATLLDLLQLEASIALGGASLRARLEADALFPDSYAMLECRLEPELLERLGGELLPGEERGLQAAVVDERWKYIWTRGGRQELYDLGSDPAEAQDLHGAGGAHAELAQQRLARWLARVERAPQSGEQRVGGATQAELDALGY